MVNPIQPITIPPTVPVVTESERIATEGEGGQGNPLPYQPTPTGTLQKPAESETETRPADPSALLQLLHSIVEQENIELEFVVDETTQKLVLRVRDAETKQILQQIPPEIALRIARFVTELLQREGIIADVRA
jgi:flagellar protein FlaG